MTPPINGTNDMVNINIILPDELHTNLKLAAALRRTSLKDYITTALETPPQIQTDTHSSFSITSTIVKPHRRT